MFAIYDNSGRQFRDTLEQFYKIKKLSAPSNVLNINKQQIHERRQHSPASQQAIEAYKASIKLSAREQVYHVHQVMSSPVMSIDYDTSLETARQRFRQTKIHQMPVLNEHQMVCGIITKHLLQKTLLNQTLGLTPQRKVSDFMTRQVITADPITDIRRVVKILIDYHLNAMPIVNEQDRLIGIVSRKDILQAVINDPPLNLFT